MATLTYEVDPSSAPEAVKLLRAELVGRRWHDRSHDERLPFGTLFIRRNATEHEIVDDVHAACAAELRDAVLAVRATGRALSVRRAWIHVSGGGMVGLVHVE